MARFENENGRMLSAPAGSFLERRLLRDGWKVISEDAPAAPVAVDPKPVDAPVEKPDLSGKTRAELDAIASDLGVEDPESLPNIAAVKTAIAEF